MSRLVDRLVARADEHAAARQAIADETPKVLDAHSDGRRVRYVRHEVAEQTLRAVVKLLEDEGDELG